jgi:hypothetical protein
VACSAAVYDVGAIPYDWLWLVVIAPARTLVLTRRLWLVVIAPDFTFVLIFIVILLVGSEMDLTSKE